MKPRYHAEPRATPESRVLSALVQATEPMRIDAIDRVCGLTRVQSLAALLALVERGTVKPLGDLRYSLANSA